MVQWSGNRDMKDQGLYSGLVTEILYAGPGMVQWSANSDMLDQGCYIGLVTEICRTRDGSEVLYQRYAGPGMVRRSGNRDKQTGVVQLSGNRDMQDQGWYSGLVTDICRTREGTVVWYKRYAELGMVQWFSNRDMQDQG
jgi:hypothetical protein